MSRTIIGQRVKRGMVQDVEVSYDAKGKSTVKPIGEWKSISMVDISKWIKATERISL